jgi:hypothetical protein
MTAGFTGILKMHRRSNLMISVFNRTSRKHYMGDKMPCFDVMGVTGCTRSHHLHLLSLLLPSPFYYSVLSAVKNDDDNDDE